MEKTTQKRSLPKREASRWLTVVLIFVVVLMGLLSKHYVGFGQAWIAKYVGNILYSVFWCLFVFIFIPTHQRANKIPLWVFGGSCVVEFLKLWHPPLLEWMRSYLWGRLLLGTTFNWWNLPHYGIGSLLSWLWFKAIAITKSKATTP